MAKRINAKMKRAARVSKKPFLSVIYPAFNEEENVKLMPRELLPALAQLEHSRLFAHRGSYEVIIVDDGSIDGTARYAQKLAAADPHIRLISHRRNRGLGAAIRTGIKHAHGELLVTIDGDYTFHPRQIKNLLARFSIGDVDCVIGSPTLRGYGKNVPRYRIFLSKGVNALYRILLRKKITAVSPIFRLYKTDQLKKLHLSSNRFEINAEILFKLLQDRRRVVEIPALLTTRKQGVSKLNNAREIKNHLLLLAKMAAWTVRRR